MSDGPPRLTEASLALDGAARLAEAAENVWYVLSDLGEPLDWLTEIKQHNAVTPIHEAGHAVAQTLAGRTVKLLSYAPFGGKHLGVSITEGTRHIDLADLEREVGAHGMAREVVVCFAGPIAELRHDPSRVFSGMRADQANAENICKWIDFEGLGERFEWRDTAWREACLLFQDPNVWAATIEIATRLRKSRSMRPRVSGGAVRTIVAKHCPHGWNWRGIFLPSWKLQV